MRKTEKVKCKIKLLASTIALKNLNLDNILNASKNASFVTLQNLNWQWKLMLALEPFGKF